MSPNLNLHASSASQMSAFHSACFRSGSPPRLSSKRFLGERYFKPARAGSVPRIGEMIPPMVTHFLTAARRPQQRQQQQPPLAGSYIESHCIVVEANNNARPAPSCEITPVVPELACVNLKCRDAATASQLRSHSKGDPQPHTDSFLNREALPEVNSLLSYIFDS